MACTHKRMKEEYKGCLDCFNKSNLTVNNKTDLVLDILITYSSYGFCLRSKRITIQTVMKNNISDTEVKETVNLKCEI